MELFERIKRGQFSSLSVTDDISSYLPSLLWLGKQISTSVHDLVFSQPDASSIAEYVKINRLSPRQHKPLSFEGGNAEQRVFWVADLLNKALDKPFAELNPTSQWDVLSRGHPHLPCLVSIVAADVDPKKLAQTLVNFPTSAALLQSFVCNHPHSLQVVLDGLLSVVRDELQSTAPSTVTQNIWHVFASLAQLSFATAHAIRGGLVCVANSLAKRPAHKSLVNWLPALVTQLTVRLLRDLDFVFLIFYSKTKPDNHLASTDEDWDKRPLLGDGQFAARMIEYFTHSRVPAGSQESGKQHPVAAFRDLLAEQLASPDCGPEMKTLLVRVYCALVVICRVALTHREWTIILRVGDTLDQSKRKANNKLLVQTLGLLLVCPQSNALEALATEIERFFQQTWQQAQFDPLVLRVYCHCMANDREGLLVCLSRTLELSAEISRSTIGLVSSALTRAVKPRQVAVAVLNVPLSPKTADNVIVAMLQLMRVGLCRREESLANWLLQALRCPPAPSFLPRLLPLLQECAVICIEGLEVTLDTGISPAIPAGDSSDNPKLPSSVKLLTERNAKELLSQGITPKENAGFSYGISVYFMLFYNYLYRFKFPQHAPPYTDILESIPLAGLLLYLRKNLVTHGYLYSATRSMVQVLHPEYVPCLLSHLTALELGDPWRESRDWLTRNRAEGPCPLQWLPALASIKLPTATALCDEFLSDNTPFERLVELLQLLKCFFVLCISAYNGQSSPLASASHTSPALAIAADYANAFLSSIFPRCVRLDLKETSQTLPPASSATTSEASAAMSDGSGEEVSSADEQDSDEEEFLEGLVTDVVADDSLPETTTEASLEVPAKRQRTETLNLSEDQEAPSSSPRDTRVSSPTSSSCNPAPPRSPTISSTPTEACSTPVSSAFSVPPSPSAFTASLSAAPSSIAPSPSAAFAPPFTTPPPPPSSAFSPFPSAFAPSSVFASPSVSAGNPTPFASAFASESPFASEAESTLSALPSISALSSAFDISPFFPDASSTSATLWAPSEMLAFPSQAAVPASAFHATSAFQATSTSSEDTVAAVADPFSLPALPLTAPSPLQQLLSLVAEVWLILEPEADSSFLLRSCAVLMGEETREMDLVRDPLLLLKRTCFSPPIIRILLSLLRFFLGRSERFYQERLECKRSTEARRGQLLSLLRSSENPDLPLRLDVGMHAARFVVKSLARDAGKNSSASPQVEELMLGTQSACVQAALELAERSAEMRLVAFPFVQELLTSPSLLFLVHAQGYSLKLLPFLLLHLPAIRTSDLLPRLLAHSEKSQVFALQLLIAISQRFPSPHLQEMAQIYFRKLSDDKTAGKLYHKVLPFLRQLIRIYPDLSGAL